MAKRNAGVVYLADRTASDRQNLLARVIRDHEMELRQFLRARLASHPDREDMMQEVFLRLTRQDDLETRLSYGPAKTKAYLLIIASNLIHDMHRRSATHQKDCHDSSEGVTLIDRLPTPEKAVQTRQTLEAVKAVLDKLDPKCRRAFTMSRFQNMGYQEIAHQMNLSVSMIEKYVAKALIALRTQVDFEGHDS